MPKIGVIGKQENVLCFLAAGFTVYEAETISEAEAKLEIAASDCSIIFITPEYAAPLETVISKYSNMTTPAIIPLPEPDGGYGTEQIKKAVERAVGSDIS